MSLLRSLRRDLPDVWRKLVTAPAGTDVEVTLHRVPKSFRGRLIGALIPLVGARTLGKQLGSVLRSAESG